VPERTFSRRALNRATLARQMLLRREKVKPATAIERLAGMQAQLARPPFVGLWSRIEGFRRETLTRAIERREVVRATMMRGTLHLVSRADFLSFRAVLQPMLSQGVKAVLRDRANGLNVDALVAAARAYFDEMPRTFDGLRVHLRTRFPKLDERAMGYIVRMHLPLVQIPAAGATWAYPAAADFAVAESWLDQRLDADDRPHTLALRYLAAFGPATLRDFQTWSAIAAAPGVVEELRPKLRTFRDERGRELLDLPKAPRPDEREEAPVRFLPEFDNLLLGFADRTRIIADEHRPLIYTKNLLVPATFLVDGFAAGTWKVERKKNLARLSVKPFGALTKRIRMSLAQEGEALLRFLEEDAPAISVEFVE
jgi:Winged helix DNA-binding domain